MFADTGVTETTALVYLWAIAGLMVTVVMLQHRNHLLAWITGALIVASIVAPKLDHVQIERAHLPATMVLFKSVDDVHAQQRAQTSSWSLKKSPSIRWFKRQIGFDKVGHFFLFLIWTLLVVSTVPLRSWHPIGYLFAFSASTEILQLLVADRSGTLSDFIANGVGIVFALLLWSAYRGFNQGWGIIEWKIESCWLPSWQHSVHCLYQQCPHCHNGDRDRLNRLWWMRLLLLSRYYRCFACHHTYLCWSRFYCLV